MVGVTVQGDLHRVLIKVDIDHWPYINTKPLHGSQTIKKAEKDYVIIGLHVKLNFELQSLLLSHGEKIEVLEPMELKNKIVERARKIK